MKHYIADEVHVKLKHEHDISVEALGGLVDKVVEGTVTVIVVATAAHILRSWLT